MDFETYRCERHMKSEGKYGSSAAPLAVTRKETEAKGQMEDQLVKGQLPRHIGQVSQLEQLEVLSQARRMRQVRLSHSQ